MKRSKHNLSHYKLMSADMGKLYPIGVMEVLPGDTIQHSTSALVRVAPLLAPVMHPVHCYIRHFFVPSRILWDGFEDFITGGPDGRNSDLPPVVNITPPVAPSQTTSVSPSSNPTLCQSQPCPSVPTQ